MPLGRPAIPTLRADPKTGLTDVRSLQGVINALTERLRQVEETLGGTVSANNAGLFSELNAQPDGLVVKANGILVTRKLEVSDSLSIDNATGAANPKISAPMLDDVDAAFDGFVVKTGPGTATTRTLIGGSGSGITIHNPDGVAGDPDFTVP